MAMIPYLFAFLWEKKEKTQFIEICTYIFEDLYNLKFIWQQLLKSCNEIDSRDFPLKRKKR